MQKPLIWSGLVRNKSPGEPAVRVGVKKSNPGGGIDSRGLFTYLGRYLRHVVDGDVHDRFWKKFFDKRLSSCCV